MTLEGILGVLGFILALATVIVPVIQGWWRRKQSAVLAFPVGQVEIGFSSFGNLIALEGNFRAEADDFFVHGLTALVSRELDGTDFGSG